MSLVAIVLDYLLYTPVAKPLGIQEFAKPSWDRHVRYLRHHKDTVVQISSHFKLAPLYLVV